MFCRNRCTSSFCQCLGRNTTTDPGDCCCPIRLLHLHLSRSTCCTCNKHLRRAERHQQGQLLQPSSRAHLNSSLVQDRCNHIWSAAERSHHSCYVAAQHCCTRSWLCVGADLRGLPDGAGRGPDSAQNRPLLQLVDAQKSLLQWLAHGVFPSSCEGNLLARRALDSLARGVGLAKAQRLAFGDAQELLKLLGVAELEDWHAFGERLPPCGAAARS